MVIWRMNHHVPQLCNQKTLKQKKLSHLVQQKITGFNASGKISPFFFGSTTHVPCRTVPHPFSNANTVLPTDSIPTCCRMALLAASTAERRIGPMGPDCHVAPSSRGAPGGDGISPRFFREISWPLKRWERKKKQPRVLRNISPYNNISNYVDYLEQTNGVFLGFKDAKMGVVNGHSS